MHGFQPNSSRRREPEGGVIHGPGTGTSDSIEDAVPAGTCIMPADSTEQIGDQALAGMGACGFTPKSQRKDVDVRLSNGEQSCPSTRSAPWTCRRSTRSRMRPTTR